MPIYHKHHIIPKHMGGTNDLSNLVSVTVEEHANLHKQLWEDLGHEEDRIAWQMLSGQINLDDAKQQAMRNGQLNSAKNRTGKPLPDTTKTKLKGPRPHVCHPNKGKKLGPRPDHVKEKIRKALLDRKHDEIRKESNRQGQLKRFSNPEEHEKIKVQLSIARTYRSKSKDK